MQLGFGLKLNELAADARRTNMTVAGSAKKKVYEERSFSEIRS